MRSKASNLRAELEVAAKAKGSSAVENRALEAAQKVDDLAVKITKVEVANCRFELYMGNKNFIMFWIVL